MGSAPYAYCCEFASTVDAPLLAKRIVKPPERLLLTGAAGTIGSVLRRAWRDQFDELRLADIQPLDDCAPGEVPVELDLTDFHAAREVMTDVDVLVHLAAIGSEDDFPRLLDANVRATYNVFEAARQAGVRRVVFASTSHVTGFYPRTELVGPHHAPRPDTVYAVTKVFGEALGRLYADKFGLEVVCVRIGAFSDVPEEPAARSMWLSRRDAVDLFSKCVSAPVTDFTVVYGVSANADSWWDNSSAGSLGYAPQDSAKTAPPGGGYQGGQYVAPSYHSYPDRKSPT
jgi:uronate dehydrogenase